VVITQPITVHLNSLGTATITAAQVNNGSSDVCGINTTTAPMSVSPNTFTCANRGVNPVLLTVTDVNGNVRTGFANVTVADTSRPIVVAQNISVQLSSLGTVTITGAQLNNGSTDNCAVTSYTATPATFTCGNIGANNVLLTATDASGNSNTTTVVVTVNDTVRPVVITQPITVHLNSLGTATITAAQVNNGSSDACGINTTTAPMSVSPSTFTCANRGVNSVVLTVTDVNGNVRTGFATVTVLDTIRPVVLTQNRTIHLSSVGVASVSAAQIDNGSTDAVCGISTFALSKTTFDCSNRGANTVILTVTDLSGNTMTGTAIVTVLDTVRPLVITRNITAQLAANGTASILASQVNNGSSDFCGIASITVSPNSFTCANRGANVVTLTVTDSSGNFRTGTALVTVADTVRPVVITRNVNAFLNSSGTFTLLPSQVNNGSFDSCGIDVLVVSPNTFTCLNLGNNTVTLTATDVNNNTRSATAIVTIFDTISPNIITQNINAFLSSSGTVSITASQLNNGTNDACGIATTSISPSSFNCTNVGARNVVFTATDVNGNSRTANVTVTVIDSVRPVVVTRSGLVYYLNNSGTAVITASQIENGSTDNCGIASISLFPTSLNCSDVGNKTVTLSVTDVNGNVATGIATVIVLDPAPPVARPRTRVNVFLSTNGQAVINPSTIDSASTDNCSITGRLLSQSTFTCANIGNNNIVFTVLDPSGNSSNANVIINVIDTISPVATISNQNIYLNASGSATITAAQVNNNSTDNCAVNTIAISKSIFACSDLGNNMVNFTVTDFSNNSRIVPVLVNVFDTIRPVVRTKANLIVYLNATGNTSITTTDADSATTDNCAVTTRTLSLSNFNCTNIGLNTVTLSATDATGNIGTRNFTVNVIDSVRPILTTRNVTLYVNNSGGTTLTPAQVILSASDNCNSTLTSSVSQTNFTCANLGSNTVNVTVTDGANNFRTLTATVTVLDTVRPTVAVQNRTIYLNGSGLATLTAAQVNNGTTDNCTLSATSISKTTFTAADLGLNTIVFTATDNTSNTQTANVIITVLDTVRPVAIAQNRTIYLNASGDALVTAAQVNNGSSDNVGVTSLLLSRTAFNCSDLGVNQVTLTVNDISNNSATTTATITVLDTIRPNVIAQNLTAYLNGLGTVTIAANQLNNGSTDNCTIATFGLSKSIFVCTDRGTNSVVLTVTDGSNNTTTASVTITILDTIRPNVVINNNLNLYLNGSGVATLTTGQVNNGSTDNCGITGLTLSATTFNSSNLGLNVLTFTATDASSNTRSVSVNVNVLDTTRPVAIAQNATIYLNTSGLATLTTLQVNNGSSDNVGINTLSLSKSTFNCNDRGANTVILSVTDLSNNVSTASAIVTVLDTIRPVITAQNLIVYLDGFGAASITANQVNNGTTDNCGVTSLSLSKTNFTCTDRGNNSVMFSATDASGNVRTAFVNVSVLDTVRPIVIVNNNLNLYLNASGNVSLTTGQVNNGSSDNCGITSLTLSATSFNGSNLGLNVLTFTATDASSNTRSVSVNVNVLDSTRPNAIAQNRTIYLNASGTASVTAAQVNNGSTDNVGVTTLSLNTSTFNCNNIGNNTVILSVRDISNNVGTATAVITVLDSIRPTVNANNITVYLNGIGNATVTAAQVNNASTDNCGITNYTLSKTNFTCIDRGANIVTLTANDESNNFASATLTITVLDTIKPNLIVNNNLNIYLNASGTASITTNQVNNGSNDNCGIASYTLSKSSFNGTNLGLNVVTFTAIDESNNSQTALVNVIVNDTISPVLIVQDKTIYLNAAGNVILASSDVNNGSTDNVGIISTSLSKTLFNCNDAGTNLVEFFANDVSGNRSSKIVTITVLDTIFPVVSNVPSNITLGYCKADYFYNLPTATDNCGGVTITQIAGVKLGDKYPVGITTNTFEITDKSGNKITRSFTVTVLPGYIPDSFPTIRICSSVQPFALTPNNAKGIYTFVGSGVTFDGKLFDAALSGPGNFNITYSFIDSNLCTSTGNFFVTVNRSPDKPTINRISSNVLEVAQSFDTYQWKRYGQPEPNGGDKKYSVVRTGLYSVRVGTYLGCFTESDPIQMGAVSVIETKTKDQIAFTVYPNPSNGLFNISMSGAITETTDITIYDAIGKLVYQSEMNSFETQVDLSKLADGTYYVRLNQGDNKSTIKPIVITK
jgi:hypothetical protein